MERKAAWLIWPQGLAQGGYGFAAKMQSEPRIDTKNSGIADQTGPATLVAAEQISSRFEVKIP
jgi:hypothetical protein